MIRTASRTSLRRAIGAIGRCTRGVTPPFAQVTVIGMVAKLEASADRGTSTTVRTITPSISYRRPRFWSVILTTTLGADGQFDKPDSNLTS
jgi:hypothetical protein